MGDKLVGKLSKKGRAVLIASLFIFLISGLGLYYIVFGPEWQFLYFLNKKTLEQSSEEIVIDLPVETTDLTCPDCKARWLDGVLVESNAEVFPVAIMIDNDPAARPQLALSQASLVYEVPVEGGMTRYLAIYPADQILDQVGPVRSARPYFVDLASELKALYLHVGGSPESLEKLKTAGLYDLNEFYYEKYFWRDNNFIAPHHIFTNSEKWQSYLDNRGLNERAAEAWLFKEEAPNPEIGADINIRFSANFQALWRYEPESNTYLRFFNGREANDNFGQIRAKNIIIQYVDSTVIDELGRLEIDLIGSGSALLCVDAHCELGTWRKASASRTRYYYDNGEEFRFNPGITWIELADSMTKVEY